MRTRSVSWLRALVCAVLAVLILGPCSNLFPATAFGPQLALAHHSAAGGVGPGECGNLVSDQVGLMTKGRTDGMVATASYSQGCQSYRLRTLIGTGHDEAYGYPGQKENCEYFGRQDVVNTFAFYFDTIIDPAQVKVSCSRYVGPD
jgi:hypothetical protein